MRWRAVTSCRWWSSATVFGVALAAIGEKGRPLVEVLESVAQTMFVVTRYVMALSRPIGVFAAIASTVGQSGLGVLMTLGKLVAVMLTWRSRSTF